MGRWERAWVCVAMLATIVAALSGCSEAEDTKTPTTQTPTTPPPKIVSYAPALTQMLRDLKLDDSIVGVGEYDDAAPKGVPVVGSFLDVDSEKLVKIKPTHVVMMVGQEGPPARLVELSKTLGFELVTYRYPASIFEVCDIVAEGPVIATTEPAIGPAPPSLGKLFSVEPAARTLRNVMFRRTTLVADAVKTDSEPEPSVLVVIGTGPLMASGPRTVLDDALHFAGGRNAAWDAKAPSPTYDREKLVAIKPDVILFMQPGGEALKGIDEDPRLAELRGLDIPAVKNNRVHLINDPVAMLPSSALPRVIAVMAKALHPSKAKEIDAALSSPIVTTKSEPATTAPDAPAAPPSQPASGVPSASGAPGDDKPAAPSTP